MYYFYLSSSYLFHCLSFYIILFEGVVVRRLIKIANVQDSKLDADLTYSEI